MPQLRRLFVTGVLCFVLGAMLAGPHGPHVGIAQDKTAPKADKTAGSFRLIMAGSGKGWQAIRYRQTTGEAWLIDKGNWVHMNEADKIPAGDYEVQLLLMEAEWVAMRIDKATGRSWNLIQGKWVETTERK
jgi:hypothetical protein